MKLRYPAIALACLYLGWFSRGYLVAPSHLEQELMENEAACQNAKFAGQSAYVVSRWGELRGCVIVPTTDTNRQAHSVFFLPAQP